MKSIVDLYDRIVKFITQDIWQISIDELSKSKSVLVRDIKIILICLKSFFENRVSVQASALTLFTIMLIIPIVALIFAIAKGFSIDSLLQKYLMEYFSDHQDMVDYIMGFANSALENTKGGIIAGVGAAVLLWSFVNMLINIENAFNHIWNVTSHRSWVRRFTSYLSVMIIVPIFFVAASSISVTLHYHIDSLEENYPALAHLSSAVRFLLNLMPYILTFALLLVTYMLMPNTRVQFKAALLASIIAGIAFVLTQNLYVYSQVTISNYSTIYGSFAAIPLFILWAKLSWLIVLFGAQLSYAYQNVDTYEYNSGFESLSVYERKIVTLLILRELSINFTKRSKPLSDKQLATKLGLPIRLVQQAIYNLIDLKLAIEVIADTDEDKFYQPAIDVHKLTLTYVLQKFEMVGHNKNIHLHKKLRNNKLANQLTLVLKDTEQSEHNILLIDIK